MKPSGPMRSAVLAGVACLAALALASCSRIYLAPPANDAEAVLMRADRAMGGVGLRTLAFTASGTGATFGQAYQPGMPWPLIDIPSFSRVADYEYAALREDSARARAEATGGGALPLMGTGEQRSTGFVRGTVAWNLAGTMPAAAPSAVDARIHDLWTSPHGVIKAALRNQPVLRTEGTLSRLSFTEPGRFKADLWIGADNLVQRVDSVMPNPVLGDLAVITLYTDYRDFGGVRFPTRIRQSQGGFPVLDLQVREVQANLPSGIEVPDTLAGAAERVAVEKVADGVWFLGGGSHNSVLIEMRDHLILVESPLYDGRANAVLAEVRRLVPRKELRYVINSHHHFDHSGGLRAAAATGATLVISEQARPWFERVLANPNTVQPDALALSGKAVAITTVNGQRSFNDGTRTVDVLMVEESVHAAGFMMVWLPRERLLVEADAWTPGVVGAAAPVQANGNNVNLVANIERLKLDVDRILPLHGRVATMNELYVAVGRRR